MDNLNNGNQGPAPMEWVAKHFNEKVNLDVNSDIREEATEALVYTYENQVKNVKVSHRSAKKKPINKNLISVGLAVTVIVGSAASMLHSGTKIISNAIYPQIEHTFYITPTNNAITDAYTREYVSSEFLVETIQELGYSIDQAAIVADYCYGVDSSRIKGSSMLGRMNAKFDAFVNKKVNVEEHEEQRGAMKL